MRCILLFALILIANTNYAQRSLNGVFNINGRCFDKAGYSLSYSFSKETGRGEKTDFALKCNLSISFNFPSNATFTYGDRRYTLSDLGLSQWPQAASYSMGLELELAFYHGNTLIFKRGFDQSYKTDVGSQIQEHSYSAAEQKTVKIERWFVSAYSDTRFQNFDIQNCRVEVEGIREILCPSFAGDLSSKISSKNNSGNSSSSSNSGSTPTSSSSTSAGSSSNSPSYSSSGTSSTTTSSSSSSLYTPETVALVSTAVDAGISFFDGLAASARAKREKKINDKLEAAEAEVKRRNLENCNTPTCNDAKGDIYRDASAEGMKGFSFRSTYTYELWKIAEAYYIKAAAEGNTASMESLISYYRFSTNKNNDMVKYWLDRLVPIYEKDAKKGSAYSMWKLAKIYDNTYNAYSKAYEDNNKGIYWYDQAATKGDVDAQVRLLDVYKDGKMDQKKDYVKALKYANTIFNNSSASLDQKKDAKKEIIDIYKDGGYGVDKNPQLAKEWESKVPDFYERFYNNSNGWTDVAEKKYEAGIRNQRYMLQLKSPGTRASVISIPCYQDKDFVISTRIRKLEGSDEIVFGLMMGADKKLDKFYSLLLTGSGEVALLKKNSTSDIMIGGKPDAFIKGDKYNEISLKKMGSKFRLYLNDAFVGECNAEYFFGDKFGFLVYGKDNNFKMDADYLIIKELKPETSKVNSSPQTPYNTNNASTSTNNALVVFSDNFSENQYAWFEKETSNCRMKIVNGKYQIDSKGGNWFVSLPLDLDKNRNYEVSASMTKVNGTDNYYFGVILGKNLLSGYHHIMAITGSGQYVLANKGDSPMDIIQSKNTGIVNTGNVTNTIKLKKLNNKFELYINNKLAGTTEAQELYGGQFGFQVWSGNEIITIDFDDLVVRYID